MRREKQLNVRPGDIILEFINIIYWPPAGNVGSVICEGRIVVKRTKLHNIYILILEKFIPISDLCTNCEREQSFIVVIRIRK